MTRDETHAVGLLLLLAEKRGAETALDALEAAAPTFRWKTAADRWTLVEVSRSVRALLFPEAPEPDPVHDFTLPAGVVDAVSELLALRLADDLAAGHARRTQPIYEGA